MGQWIAAILVFILNKIFTEETKTIVITYFLKEIIAGEASNYNVLKGGSVCLRKILRNLQFLSF